MSRWDWLLLISGAAVLVVLWVTAARRDQLMDLPEYPYSHI